MDIWLLRHAAAEERSATGKDADRELTAEGLKRAERVARGLAALEPGIARLLTAPYRAAPRRAGPAARELGLERETTSTRALEPHADPEDVLEELAAEGGASALLVGHEPHLSALLGRLIGGPGLSLPLKKASVAWVEREGRSGTLRALLPARVLERIR